MSRRRRRKQQSQSSEPTPRSLPSSSFGLRLSSSFFASIPDTEEFPTRSPDLAKQIIDLVNHCPEAGVALEVLCAYALSSGTGDELGFAVLPDENDPRPNTVKIARAVIDRVGDIWLWWQVIWRFLAWGDAFGLMEIDTKAMQVEALRLLPTWQIHAIPDETTGQIIHYEQRFGGRREHAVIQPLSMVQWSYNRRYLYGRSLYREALPDWAKLKDVDQDLSDASREAALQPNVHIMPPGADENYKQAYKSDHEARKKKGIVPDIYLLQGAEVKKPMGLPSSFPLTGFLDHHLMRRARIAMRSRVPPYLLGIDSKFAKEISMQPAIAFVVQVGLVRQLFSAGLRQLINTELALKNVSPNNWVYRIVFPKINVNPYAELIEEDVDQPGVTDSDFVMNGGGYD
ncbi:hypothetical protein H6G89_32545 [Oscillatoria sp. FACHB-1407]|uniref:hypothetical protein n=1 Tax=Oscillatoria sp. FACHB-1407 TaxID=2692847 RepID=UPI001684347D|nr:hypothetical protein [Oscillatoria sp. FACHB-1407]MBD2465719.1 hypothetical protein [Oscillatoria sp. FACHB-1407]